MKTILAALLLIIPIFAYAGREDQIRALDLELSSVNSMRKAERQKGEEVYAKFERGEMSEDLANQSFDEIEERVNRLNERKSSIESQLGRLRKRSMEANSTSISNEPRRPPVPLTAKEGGKAFDSILKYGGIALAILIVGAIIMAFLRKDDDRSTSISENAWDMTHTLSSSFGLTAEQMRRIQAQIGTSRPVRAVTFENDAAKPHSGNVPSNLT